jgi:pimeloyl-ACP methyl ester carboxylesterase
MDLDVRADLAVQADGDERQGAGVRQVETDVGGLARERRFPLRTLREGERRRVEEQVPPEQLAQRGPGERELAAVAIEAEGVGAPDLVGREQRARGGLVALEPHPEDVDFARPDRGMRLRVSKAAHAPIVDSRPAPARIAVHVPALAALAALGCSTMPTRLFSPSDRADPARKGEVRFASAGWGEILVPENRRVSSGRLISLRFRREETTGRPPLLVFGGGPGMSNFKQSVPPQVAEKFDVVWAGYRGIDSSQPLDCEGLRKAIRAPRLGSASAQKEMADAFAACVEGWRKGGIDIQGYQIRDVVDDAEDLRRALGLGAAHLFAVSYGTRVAQAYMTLHPRSVERVVLLSPNPPGHFFWSVEDVHRAFDAYQPFFERAHPEYAGRTTLEALCAEVDARLERAESGRKIDPGRARALTFILLFHQSTSSWAFDAYLRAYRDGDYGGLAALSALYDYIAPRAFEWGDFLFQGLVNAWEPGRDYSRDAAPAPGRYGSPLGTALFAPPYRRHLFDFRDPALAMELRAPTLALGGALDFSTPAHLGRALADSSRGTVHHVVAPALGHAGDFFQDAALGPAMVAFYEREALPQAADFASREVTFGRRLGLGDLRGVLGLVLAAVLAALVVVGILLL